MGDPQNDLFMMENPIKMDLGVPPFQETSMWVDLGVIENRLYSSILIQLPMRKVRINHEFLGHPIFRQTHFTMIPVCLIVNGYY
jgi:hypothetical protein